MKKQVLMLALLCATPLCAHAGQTYGGIYFPDGAVSFADVVYDYSLGEYVGTGWDLPSAALGAPDNPGTNSSYSLGVGGWLILQFTDNSLTTSGDSTPDLHVFEIGGAVEWFNVAISTDATTWIDLGNVRGQPTSIDIDAVAGVIAGAKYSYVRLTDDPSSSLSGSPYAEADIDAVGAISSASPATIPAPGAVMLGSLGMGLVGWLRRRKKI